MKPSSRVLLADGTQSKAEHAGWAKAIGAIQSCIAAPRPLKAISTLICSQNPAGKHCSSHSEDDTWE